PARWLQRLDAVLKAANLTLPITDWVEKAQGLDQISGLPVPIQRPGPRPPVEKRPVRLSVTEIETWMRDPYAIYARHVLSLQEIDPIDESPDASDRGTLLHDALERFVKTYPNELPDHADRELRKIGHELLDQRVEDIPTRHFWGVRFDKMADWFIPHERTWRTQARMTATEIKGVMTLPGTSFTLSGKADRFDIMQDGSGLAIIDYKTGFSPSDKHIIAGISPQLPLEAAMVQAGSFPGLPPMKVAYLGHWKLNGGKDGREKPVDSPPDKLAAEALNGLTDLVNAFADPQTPYLSQPRPSARPRYSDYAHLARVKEWSVLDESGGEDT
ncbi:MAG: PD-(D/E)XK nuclease family protein, partial [Verrucomicrobiales bacterium]